MRGDFDDILGGIDLGGMHLGDVIPPNENDGTIANGDETATRISPEDFMRAFEDDTVEREIARRRALIGVEHTVIGEFHAISDEFRQKFGVDDWVIGVAAQASNGDSAKFRAILGDLCGQKMSAEAANITQDPPTL